MRDKRYRDGYVAAHTRQVLAKQMREFRGKMSQTSFAKLIGKRQTMISRLENPSYVGWTLSTMLEVANKLGVAVFVRFVDFPTFLRLTEDISDAALHPRVYDQSDLDKLLNEQPGPIVLRPRREDDPIPSYRIAEDRPIEPIPAPIAEKPPIIEPHPTVQ
jgi:hypothetical protein